MKKIHSDSGFLAYQKYFKHIQSNNSVIVVWQVDPETGERNVSNSRLNSFHMESKLLHFEMPQDCPIASQLPVYCYAEDGQFIFKTDIQVVKGNVFSIVLPSEIQLLEDPDIILIKGKIGLDLSDVWKTKKLSNDVEIGPDYMRVKSMSERSSRDQDFLNNEFESVSLDEEDKIFADKRESPRARPKIDKWVKVKMVDGEVQLLKLFDLSRGGLGFISLEPLLFPKGGEVHVVGFEAFDLDDPIIGKVMSHRPIDDGSLEYKIGVKFDDGQD